MSQPAHINPASLRVGVIGRGALPALFAILLRDYGHHRVVGYRLDPVAVVDPEAADRWANLPIPNAPRMSVFLDNVDIAYLFHPGLVSELRLHNYIRRRAVTGVLAVWDLPQFLVLTGDPTWWHTPAAYNPIPAEHSLESLANPEAIVVAAEDPRVVRQVKALWTPIINTAPVVVCLFSEVPSTGLLWPPAASGAPPGVSTPPAPSEPTERPQNAPGR